MKEQKIGVHDTSVRLAKLSSLVNRAEEIFEENDVVCTTDLEDLFSEVPVEGVKSGKGPYPYSILYREIYMAHLNFLKQVFMDYSKKTMGNGVEFISFTLDTGEYVIFEGEENRVSLPMPHGVTSAHTHPGICLFSNPDLETADNLLIKGYFSIGVMNPECALILYRNGPYTLEDRDSLLDLASKVKKAKTLEELTKAYNSFRAPNLAMSLNRL
ncbi:hypothetical protein L3N51_00936 [Metallosphaera sp. J1]|uniref:hypothetical protein n=1 Tax=Metallosphaera javensis (ex Hofmann et al. 2022) TaxID=99938 RepID=UPI001EE0519B|nr:hypothetical protein [Metallosphaera javensis (ex Hofmann et al. 2022)]MCG3108652.1 hypothetical protein [Metallosphaera javensis (ex Hofmann et al. 2022)]